MSNVIIDMHSSTWLYFQTSIWCDSVVECTKSDFSDEVIEFRSLYNLLYKTWGKEFYLKSNSSCRYYVVYPEYLDLFKKEVLHEV